MRPESDLSNQGTWQNASETKDREMRLILSATEDAVRRGLKSIKRGLEPDGFAADELSSLEIVLAEVLNNIVEHAYTGRRDGKIDIRLIQSADGLHCIICDTGKMMPGGEPPLGQQVSLNCAIADVPEGGFGWFLIRELAHDLKYERADGQNQLSFRMTIGNFAQSSEV